VTLNTRFTPWLNLATLRDASGQKSQFLMGAWLVMLLSAAFLLFLGWSGKPARRLLQAWG